MASRPAVNPIAPKEAAPVKEKQKAVAFVNWSINGSDGKVALRSNKGFPLYENEFITLEEKALVELAKNNGGTAVVMAELRIVIAQERPEHLDISKIQLVAKP